MFSVIDGFLAGVYVGMIGNIILWFRRGSAVPEIKASYPKIANWSDGRIVRALSIAPFAIGIGIGPLAGWIYDRISAFSDNAPFLFFMLAVILGILATILSAICKLPLRRERILLSILFSLGLGIMVPLVAG